MGMTFNGRGNRYHREMWKGGKTDMGMVIIKVLSFQDAYAPNSGDDIYLSFGSLTGLVRPIKGLKKSKISFFYI